MLISAPPESAFPRSNHRLSSPRPCDVSVDFFPFFYPLQFDLQSNLRSVWHRLALSGGSKGVQRSMLGGLNFFWQRGQLLIKWSRMKCLYRVDLALPLRPHKKSWKDRHACLHLEGRTGNSLCVRSLSDLDFESNFTTLYSCSSHFLLRQHRKAPNPKSRGLCDPSPFASFFLSLNEVSRKLLSKCLERSFPLILGLSASRLYLQYNLTSSATAPSLCYSSALSSFIHTVLCVVPFAATATTHVHRCPPL